MLSVLHGLLFDATRFGHLVHHRFSRRGYDRPDVYDGSGAYALSPSMMQPGRFVS